MIDKFNILYVDDLPEAGLERYLDEVYTVSECETEYSEIIFSPENGYESLIQDPLVKTANIIFIDSKLFENRTVVSGKFSGEEFKIILKKYYPFIEVIVITQNEADPDVDTISKYDSKCGKTALEYYAEYLPPLIQKAMENILVYRRIAEKLEDNDNWEAIIKEKILNSINGVGTYDELSKADIDTLISSFLEIQESING